MDNVMKRETELFCALRSDRFMLMGGAFVPWGVGYTTNRNL